MMDIEVQELKKIYRIPRPYTGFLGAVRSLLHREYEYKSALAGISFSVSRGELVGYIGPNGAGKSTTVKILTGILTPDAGSVRVMGKTPWKHRIETVRNLGVVFGQRTQLWWDLPVSESFSLLKTIYDVSDVAYRTTLEYLVETLDLSSLLHFPVRQLSLGQRMRCDIAASLLHSPSILFLDEPTIGLDAVSKLAVRDVIRHVNQDKKLTIMLTTHDMDDIESLCSRVLVINEGAICFDGPLDVVRKSIAPERYLIVDLLDEKDSVKDDEAVFVNQEGHRVWLSFYPEKTKTPDLISRILANHPIRDLFVEDPSIEEIIARFYRRNSV
jgi:ABC-2 type transport system ATP-binding protein